MVCDGLTIITDHTMALGSRSVTPVDWLDTMLASDRRLIPQSADAG